jgi:dTDP-4-dehydrorhamnose 3,5-epimerase
MPFQPMGIQGAFVFTPVRHEDQRGTFQENFKLSAMESELGINFQVKQVNQSSSGKGVIRGIHYSENPPGQAKLVNCPRGSIWDVVVDLRTESPTFGKWEGVEVSAENGMSVFIAEGLGHAFLSLEEGSVISYLCSEEYNSATEHQINPRDPDLAIDFEGIGTKHGISNFILSDKDAGAQSLKDALSSNSLSEFAP